MTRDIDIVAPTLSATMAVPRDRVRWGPIIAGLFAALCTLVVLSVLGIAVGASAFDPGDPARTFGIGAGIWAAISALIAFFVGGWLAARSAAVRGHGNGTLNGAMVWITAIPVMLFILGGGLWSAGTTAVQAGSNAVTGTAQSDGINLEATAQTAANEIPGIDATGTAQQQQQQPMTERAADTTARSAWGVLVSMVLGLAAAAVGGYVGARKDRDDAYDGDNDRNRAATTGNRDYTPAT